MGKDETLVLVGLFVLAALFSLFPFPRPSSEFTIHRGESATDIVHRLNEQRVVLNPTVLAGILKLTRRENRLLAGRYMLHGRESLVEVFQKLLSGPKEELVRITFTEGMRAEEMATLLESQQITSKKAFLKAVLEPSRFPWFPYAGNTLEGFLFPDTYSFAPGLPAEEVIGTLLREFLKHLPPDAEQRAKRLHRSILEIVIIASLIEREVQKQEERPLVASVIYNRLKRGMKLEIDATVAFALNKWSALSYEDLQVDSPYNTYRYYGLPPGAIGNPGAGSLWAAFYPANTSYLYFVLTGNGSHTFSSSYAQHLQYKKNFGGRH